MTQYLSCNNQRNIFVYSMPVLFIANLIVIFPVPGNNTFETTDFADTRFSCKAARARFSLEKCSYGKNYCET